MERVKPRSHMCKSKSRLNLSFKKVKTRFLSSDGKEQPEFWEVIVGVTAQINMLGHEPVRGQ